MEPSRAPTTRDIAKVCGCSQCTVSNDLRGLPKVHPETRERILKIARDMGWQPNPFVSAYMSHFRRTRAPEYQASLAFLIATEDSNEIKDLPIHEISYYRGAERRAAEFGYLLEPIWL